MQRLQDREGLSDPKYANKLGLKYMTYRTLMGRDPSRPGREGPNLQTLSGIATHLSMDDFFWLITGREAQNRIADPPHLEIQTVPRF